MRPVQEDKKTLIMETKGQKKGGKARKTDVRDDVGGERNRAIWRVGGGVLKFDILGIKKKQLMDVRKKGEIRKTITSKTGLLGNGKSKMGLNFNVQGKKKKRTSLVEKKEKTWGESEKEDQSKGEFQG